jgi:uncharacterized membrane protein (GlpM family)
MLDVLFQIVLPFVFSALVVILITVFAEKYGTKVGGIIGTLPTTIIIAFVFIALNRGVDFASESVAVVPAEMGINLAFLCIFAILAYKSMNSALFVAFVFWIISSSVLFFIDMHNIYISLALFFTSMFVTFVVLEKVKKIKSQGRKRVHYTPMKILLRGVLTGSIIAISVFLSNLDPILAGIFSVFPAILMSTMIISYREHGPDFSAGIAKSMIFGSPSVMSYAATIHFMYPSHGIVWGSIVALIIAVIITIVIFKIRNKII